MNGFYLEGNINTGCPRHAGKGPYQYVNPNEIAPYWDIAKSTFSPTTCFRRKAAAVLPRIRI